MLEQAEAIAARMSSPKTARIFIHSLPQFEIQPLDVLTGKTMVLEDGRTLGGDSELESELLHDEFGPLLYE